MRYWRKEKNLSCNIDPCLSTGGGIGTLAEFWKRAHRNLFSRSLYYSHGWLRRRAENDKCFLILLSIFWIFWHRIWRNWEGTLFDCESPTPLSPRTLPNPPLKINIYRLKFKCTSNKTFSFTDRFWNVAYQSNGNNVFNHNSMEYWQNWTTQKFMPTKTMEKSSFSWLLTLKPMPNFFLLT